MKITMELFLRMRWICSSSKQEVKSLYPQERKSLLLSKMKHKVQALLMSPPLKNPFKSLLLLPPPKKSPHRFGLSMIRMEVASSIKQNARNS